VTGVWKILEVHVDPRKILAYNCAMQREAPAKINLRLQVVGRRADGYHLLHSIMVPLTLADEIRFERAASGVHFTTDDPNLPTGEDNLVVQAAKALLQAAGHSRGVTIHLTKRTPAAAGLGGGSSDAATVLLGLREFFELEVTDERLAELAVGIGADVPFFLKRTACLAEGIGDKLTPYPVMSGLPLALVKPRAGLATPRVYQALNWPLTQKVHPPILPPSFGDLPTVCAWLHNDLEAPAEGLLPQITECKALLRQAGAAGVMMSGSGPTVFGIFSTHQQAVRACALAEARGWWALPCFTR
jgi:4-diphosphocytidyl-2-C-methyl-D-erythritol kinase